MYICIWNNAFFYFKTNTSFSKNLFIFKNLNMAYGKNKCSQQTYDIKLNEGTHFRPHTRKIHVAF